MIDRPEYLAQLNRYRDKDVIKVVTGVRRCGKSVLLFRLFYRALVESGVDEKEIVAVNLENEEEKHLRNGRLLYEFVMERKIPGRKCYVLIDEIQYVDQFEDLVNSLKNSGCDVYVTGSNSRMLSGEISSALRGRSTEIRVYPLSFSEYYSAVGGDKKSAWNMYLRYGGFPFVAQEQDLKLKAEYLKMLESTVATRDIVERYRLRNPDLFEAVYDFLCSNIGSPVSAKKISDTLRSNGRLSITPDTVGEYLTYLTESFLFYRTYRYDVKGKGYLKTLGKYYSVDIGLRNAHLQYRQTEITHAIENIVYLELVRRGYHVDTGKNENKEIDFVARSEKDIYYIQVAYSIVETEKMEQEIGSFRGLDDGYKKIVITMDDDPFEVLPYGYRKIEMMSFLLNPNALEEI